MILRIFRKIARSLLSALLAILLFYVGYGLIYGNFHKIDGHVYRSGQLFSFNMPYYLEQYKIKTILNLRGSHPEDQWYQDEKQIAEEQDITLIDYPISSGEYLDYKKTSELVKLLKTAKKPLLIHCQGGADRTSLVAALYRYAVLKQPKAEAEKALSPIFGHLPSLRPKVIAMDQSFENFTNKTNEASAITK